MNYKPFWFSIVSLAVKPKSANHAQTKMEFIDVKLQTKLKKE